MAEITQKSVKNELKFADEETKTNYERAMQALEVAVKAPAVFVGSESTDERMELRKVYCKESLGPNPTKSVYFGTAERISVDVAKGYVPVINEHGQHVSHGGDLMYWTPIKLAQEREAVHQRESRNRMKDMRTNVKEMNSERATQENEVSTMKVDDIERNL